jgi:hypothetical protein
MWAMWALEQVAAPRSRSLLADTPAPIVGLLAGGGLLLAWLAATGLAPSPLVRVAALTALHGGLLVVSLAWAEADAGARLPASVAAITLALVAAGSIGAALGPGGAVALLGTPAWLAVLTARRRLAGLGLGPRLPVRPLLAGGMIGVFLGGHLLLSAAQTLGHPLRRDGWLAVLALWAYDLGANVVSSECFFRGALFNRLQRRWSFGPATAVATGLSLVRYVGDPLLPGQSEVLLGALLYLTILGVVNCWLLWWSGSLGPGLIAAALFFLAYRALAIP